MFDIRFIKAKCKETSCLKQCFFCVLFLFGAVACIIWLVLELCLWRPLVCLLDPCLFACVARCTKNKEQEESSACPEGGPAGYRPCLSRDSSHIRILKTKGDQLMLFCSGLTPPVLSTSVGLEPNEPLLSNEPTGSVMTKEKFIIVATKVAPAYSEPKGERASEIASLKAGTCLRRLDKTIYKDLHSKFGLFEFDGPPPPEHRDVAMPFFVKDYDVISIDLKARELFFTKWAQFAGIPELAASPIMFAVGLFELSKLGYFLQLLSYSFIALAKGYILIYLDDYMNLYAKHALMRSWKTDAVPLFKCKLCWPVWGTTYLSSIFSYTEVLASALAAGELFRTWSDEDQDRWASLYHGTFGFGELIGKVSPPLLLSTFLLVGLVGHTAVFFKNVKGAREVIGQGLAPEQASRFWARLWTACDVANLGLMMKVSEYIMDERQREAAELGGYEEARSAGEYSKTDRTLRFIIKTILGTALKLYLKINIAATVMLQAPGASKALHPLLISILLAFVSLAMGVYQMTSYFKYIWSLHGSSLMWYGELGAGLTGGRDAYSGQKRRMFWTLLMLSIVIYTCYCMKLFVSLKCPLDLLSIGPLSWLSC